MKSSTTTIKEYQTINNILNEIYTTEKTFRDGMKVFCDGVDVIINSISADEDRAKLVKLLQPYKELIDNPLEVSNFNTLSTEEKIKSIDKIFNTQFFEGQKSAFIDSIQNMPQINIYIDIMKAKYNIDFNFTGLTKEAYTIMPTQRLGRYDLLFKDLKKNLDILDIALENDIHQNAKDLAEEINQTNPENKYTKENSNLGDIIIKIVRLLVESKKEVNPKYTQLIDQAINKIGSIMPNPNAPNLNELTLNIKLIRTIIDTLYRETNDPKSIKAIKDQFKQEPLVRQCDKPISSKAPQRVSTYDQIKISSRTPKNSPVVSRNPSPDSSAAITRSSSSSSLFETHKENKKPRTVKPPNPRDKERGRKM